MTLDEALEGKEIPDEIRKNLVLVTIPYFSFGKEVREGQLVVHKEVAEEIREIFKEMLERQFPVQSVLPAVVYGWDDDASMAANNTSAFNYRTIYRTNRLSNHAHGRAIDINPALNPYILVDGTVMPPGVSYNPKKPGTITPEIASIFKSRGWEWGGDWRQLKDWQHFEKSA